VRSSLPDDFVEKINQIKNNIHLPVVAGFGISSYESAQEVLRYADGVVVGSFFVKALEEGVSYSELTKLARNIMGENS
jgi:tryptophan synthase alpha chain